MLKAVIPVQAYWPFHKIQCRRNEFADAIEEAEPKFARWMRAHGKLAVLKDDEVDRLERAAATGTRREEVMETMYGRLEPKPAAARYSAEERAAMRAREDAERAAARAAALKSASYLAIDVPRDMGLDCGDYKWRQTQSHVEIYVPLPDGMPARKAVVTLRPRYLSIELDERPVLRGELTREVKVDESTWYVQDGVLEVVLLKRSRRGNYADGQTNADTFWKSVVKGAAERETLCLEQPPTAYYWTLCDGDDTANKPLRRLPLPAKQDVAKPAVKQDMGQIDTKNPELGEKRPQSMLAEA